MGWLKLGPDVRLRIRVRGRFRERERLNSMIVLMNLAKGQRLKMYGYKVRTFTG